MKEIEELYINSGDKYVKLLTKLLRGDQASAEDVFQTSLVMAMQYYKSYKPNKGKFENWFSGILYNELYKWKKKSPRTEDIERYKWIEDDVSYINLIENIDYLEKRIKKEVDPMKRTALNMIYIKGYSAVETAKVLNQSEVAIRQWCHRFRNTLKDEL